MEKEKNQKSVILFILLLVLMVVFFINTNAVFSTASLRSVASKIFSSITTFISNSLLFSDVKPPYRKLPPKEPTYGTVCETFDEEGRIKRCVLTDATKIRMCNDDADCDKLLIKDPTPLSGSECYGFEPDEGPIIRGCVVNTDSNIKSCYKTEDCDKKFKACRPGYADPDDPDSEIISKCFELRGIGPNECSTNKDCEGKPI